MVYQSGAKLVDQLTAMSSSVSSVNLYAKSRQRNLVQKNRKSPGSTPRSDSPRCHSRCSRSAAVDFVVLIAVIGACGFLLFPYVKFLSIRSIDVIGTVASVMEEEFREAPLIYASIGLSVCCASLATWALISCSSCKCLNPDCRGLRKSAKFDIQLETEESARNSLANDGLLQRNLFELPLHQHRELEAELKKMAPPNGKAVLVFRARCGCSVGRYEVPGPKKSRKIKK